LEFAELEEYAFVPVKALSSGMKARLGFAIATDVQPDILLLDEVFSVGDASFKKKSKKRIEELLKRDITVIVVSHDLKFVQQWCKKAVWLEKGKIKFSGSADKTAEYYLASIKE
jgi:ABC-type polysaccharide/polyol phosphate transport system ATPase subunit